MVVCMYLHVDATSKAAGKKKQVELPKDSTTPSQQGEGFTGVSTDQVAAIWDALNKATQAIERLTQEKDCAFQAGLDKAAELFKATQKAHN